MRSVGNVVRELDYLASTYSNPHIVFRDPLFTAQRARTLEFCATLRRRALKLSFECETRLDDLDEELLDQLHEVGLRAVSFGVESADVGVLRRSGRRPIPRAHQLAMVAHCRALHVDTIAFYVLGLPADTWQSVAATIDLSICLGTSVASYKICTPYPGTPLWTQMAPVVFETDWEKFDGFTPTFHHPNLTPEELRFLLGAAYSRFYVRPSFLLNLLHVRDERVHRLAERLDASVSHTLARQEIARMSRPVTC
jgi:anaerobic magnesium-protoporphyrin IX monomethyl ester cyclase